MKKIGIIITDPEDWTARALIAAAKEKGFSPLVLDLRAAEVTINTETAGPVVASSISSGSINAGSKIAFKTGDTCLSDLDAVIVRDVGAGTLEGVSFRFDILRELEAEGVLVVNSPEAIQSAANKYHASYLVAKAGLPMPETIAVQSAEAAMKVISRFGDAVIKPVFGYKGKDIVRVKAGEVLFSDRKSEPASVEETLEKLLEERGMLYIQEFIKNPGRDIRAFVVGGTAVGAIYRKAAPGSWVNNLSQGGSADRCVLTEEQKAIAEKAALAIGAVFAGVDIIESSAGNSGEKSEKVASSINPGPKILEVNGTPSGKGIFDAWGINPAEHIIDYIKNIL
ncbi:RimK family alpha-L-glutamate ligase [Methanosarcina sp. KYL-1]|uniref:tetrahydromethanopterin:alpha-L-glutamate ligase n=1 Tax=Methanosarcina sp. KYL-1 TaxID=2602068 RepID=UPI002100A85B|nr:tetrahydromethanopterin:alpha-L-glutamate ligase [Methanosarcina sp. KYL-1]MCQ1536337.1 RimK family alpha-L-glutamate ligase [Methanosarcina sp. KYL-1]